MKIQIHRKRREQGTMLLVTALIAVVAGSTLAYFLTRAQQESFVVNRSEAWNKALVVAEAGIEEGMSLINRNNGNSTALTNWYTGASADGWTVSTSSGNDLYTISRDLGNGMGSYSVSLTNSPTGPVILGIGKVTCKNSLMGSDTVSRKILVYASSSSAFPGALTVKSTINMSGNNVTIDSYDSSDPLHSYWPTYPLAPGYGTYTNTGSTPNTPRKANGNVATDGSIINVGNAQIYGHADTAPGGSTSVGANGSVGNVTWVDAGNQGIAPGYSEDDMNVVFPDVTVPATNWTTFSGSSITNSGNYAMDSIGGNFSITASNVVLYLTNGINLSGNKTVSIGPNSYVTIYAGGTINDGGNGVINNGSQHPVQMIVYGLPSLTSITLHGNGAMFAAIYAPEAAVSYKGGGNSGGFNGALTGSSVVLTGNSTFSYDESLARLNMKSGYVIQSWTELTGP
ncbi:MAG TPA: hypothetical protein VK815_05070 [Candidatus Acidoferrales bacterium]|jgi:hypothetical protein|nr:hypothetical protein [Candidatus Acidoferrales bacterium]